MHGLPTRRRIRPATGKRSDLTSASAPGARCVKTTAPTAKPGNTSPTSTRARAPIAGTRMVSPASATDRSASVSLWPSGTGATRSSRNASSGSAARKEITARTPKEYWWYIDATPTASWLRWRYHYPQAEFPYALLRQENARRNKDEPEFELIDTGIFEEDRYWQITADYAKASPDDVCVRISVRNAGPDPAELHVLPTLWFRNRWSWEAGIERPMIRATADDGSGAAGAVAEEELLGRWRLVAGPGSGRPSRRRCCSARTKPTPDYSTAAPRSRRRIRRTASTITSSMARTRSILPARAPKWRAGIASRSRPVRRSSSGFASRATCRAQPRSRRRLRANSSPIGAAKPTSIMRRLPPRARATMKRP